MFTFLDTIDVYIKQNNINLKNIEISSELLPGCYNEAIKQIITKYSGEQEILDTYSLKYDSQNRLCLEITSCNNYKLLIFSDHTEFSREFKGKKITESKVVKLAEQIDFEKNIELMILYGISPRYMKRKEEIEPLEFILTDCAYDVIDYINYLINLYNNKEHYENNRFNILNSYNYTHKNFIKDNKTDEIIQANFLYQISNKDYVLILEPEDKDRFTKIVYLQNNEPITFEMFEKIAESYSKLKLNQFSNLPNTEIYSHTKDSYFNELIIDILNIPKETKIKKRTNNENY